MKIVFWTFLALMVSSGVFGQKIDEKKDFENILDTILKKRLAIIKTEKLLVVPEVFDQIIKNDYTKVQTVAKIENITNRHASISVDREKQVFSASPIIIPVGQKHLFGINFTGVTTNKGFFDFRDRKQVALEISYSLKLGKGIYNDLNVENSYKNFSQKIKPLIVESSDIRREMKFYEIKNYNEKSDRTTIDSLDKQKYLESQINKELNKYEMEYGQQNFSAKTLKWITINITPYNGDYFDYIIKDNLESYAKPIKQHLNVPKLSLSGNIYHENKNIIINASANGALSNKHSLSEIYSTTKWNEISNLTDQTYLDVSSKDVYVVTNDNFHRLLLMDFSLRCVLIWKNKLNPLGFEFEFADTKFIKPETSNDVSKIQRFDMGLVIPLKSSKGELTLNLVPFYSIKSYINYSKLNDNMMGIKFNVPF